MSRPKPTLAEVAGQYEEAKQVNSHQWEARCPCHDDRTASLSIGLGDDGRILIHCHALCATEEIVAKGGLLMSDLFPASANGDAAHNANGNGSSGSNGKAQGKRRGTFVCAYDYRDENGRLLSQALRFADPKGFSQRAPKEGGGWSSTIKDVRRVVYRLPELLKADAAELVFIVEGEKDADRLGSLGFVATTNAMGAGKWTADHSEFLRGRNVIAVPDNDDPGRAHVQQVAKSLYGKAASIRILTLPDLPEHGDISDWLNAGGTAEQLRQLAAALPDWKSIEPEAPSNHAISGSGFSNGYFDGGKIIVPLVMADVLKNLRAATNDWPRRIDQALFIDDSHGINWLDSTSACFGWLQAKLGIISWHKTLGCVGREELVAELQRTSQRYLAVEEMPHEPLIDGHYYACQKVEPGDGSTLRELLDRFCPATDIDRDLLQAALMTLFWGGPGGTRPAFLFTTDDGRGVGKSKAAELLAYVAGGMMSFSHNDPIGEIKARLLSSEALTKRVALLDNVKTTKFSWGELEALITAPVISGKRMYVGEATRPNTITWFITLNGASLTTDMAQRVVVIKLRRPTRSGNWEEDTLRFIIDNRHKLIADLIGALRAKPATLARFTRWATWEKAVLARLPEPNDAQAVIEERQGAVNVESDEEALIEEFFERQLRSLNYDPAADCVFIPSLVATRWLNWATGETHKVISAGRILGQRIDEGKLKSLRRNRCKTWGRGFVWEPRQSEIEATVWTDLEKRVAERKQSHEQESG